MAKILLKKASTNVTLYLFIQDSSVTTGAGLTGLVYNSASMVCYYVRPLAAAAALTLVTQTTTGAHTDGGFVEVDATNMPGVYRLDLSDTIVATGVDSVVVMLKGATDMAPVVLEIQLTDIDVNEGVRAGLTALPNAAAAANGGLPTVDASNAVKLQDGTGANQIDLSSGLVKLQAVTHTGAVIPTVSTLTGHTPQTGDNFARLGAPAGASVSADVAAVKTETALIVADTGTDGVVVASHTTAGKAEIEAECNDALTAFGASTFNASGDTVVTGAFTGAALSTLQTKAEAALVTYGLDHMVGVAVTGVDVIDNSIMARLVSKSATADWDDFINTTDSLQALRDQGDSAWITGGDATAANQTTLLTRLSAARAANLDEITSARLAELDAANLPADIDTLLGRLTLARAGYLDELSAANLPSDIDTLLGRLTAARAGYLDALNGHIAQTGDSFVRLGVPVGASISADIAANLAAIAVIDGIVDAILLDTGTTLPATLATLATAAALTAVASNVTMILADTGTDGVVLSAATNNAIADALLKRDVDNVEATAPVHSFATVILAVASKTADDGGGNIIIYRTDGTTAHATKAITTDAALEPISSAGVGA